jgi:hypothetical protein
MRLDEVVYIPISFDMSFPAVFFPYMWRGVIVVCLLIEFV